MSDNQCDGCARNLPITDGLHFDGRKPFMVCTKHKYTSRIKELEQENQRLREALLEAADVLDTWQIAEDYNPSYKYRAIAGGK